MVKVTGPSTARLLGNRRNTTGQVIYGETTCAALATDGTQFCNGSWRHGAAHISSPPLRPDPEAPVALMDALVRFFSLLLLASFILSTFQPFNRFISSPFYDDDES